MEGKILKIAICEILIGQLYAALTRTPDEAIAYLAGPVVGGVSVPTTYYEIETEKRSPIYALGTMVSCRDAELDMRARGYWKSSEAHSHPGKGIGGCVESDIDTDNLGRAQKSGSRAIGLIFARDGHFHFFSVYRKFEVEICGKNIRKIDTEKMDHVYKIETEKADI